MEVDIDVFCRMVDTYIKDSVWTHDNTDLAEDIYIKLSEIVTEDKGLRFLDGYVKVMESYIYLKNRYLNGCYGLKYYRRHSIMYPYADKAYILPGVHYDPFLTCILREVVLVVKNKDTRDEHRKKLESIIQQEEQRFNKEHEVRILQELYERAMAKDLNKDEKVEVETTNKTNKNYIELLKENLVARVELFTKELYRIRNNYWQYAFERFVVVTWLDNANKQEKQDDESLNIIIEVNKKGRNYLEAYEVIENAYNTGMVQNEQMMGYFKKQQKKYKWYKADQERYQYISDMGYEQKVMYLDRNLCSIMNGYLVLMRAMMKEEGYPTKKDAYMCTHSLLYTIVNCIRNVDEHPLDYRKYFEDNRHVFNMFEIERQIKHNGILTSDFDIYFNIDRYRPKMDNKGVRSSLYHRKRNNFIDFQVKRDKDNGGRLFLIYKDLTLIPKEKLDTATFDDEDTWGVIEEDNKSILTQLKSIQCVEDFLDTGVDVDLFKKTYLGKT